MSKKEQLGRANRAQATERIARFHDQRTGTLRPGTISSDEYEAQVERLWRLAIPVEERLCRAPRLELTASRSGACSVKRPDTTVSELAAARTTITGDQQVAVHP